MSYYFVAQIKINDEEEYQKYLDGVDEVFKKFNGKYLAVDYSPIVIEGEWNYDRIVMIEFPDEVEFRRWYDSPMYQEIVQYRQKAAKCDTLLVKGL